MSRKPLKPVELDTPAAGAAAGPLPAVDPVQALILASRINFAAYVSAVHRPRFHHSPFSLDTCRAVDQFVEDVIAGKRPVLDLTAPPQHGKLLHHDTPMLTANRGWITHGELRPGDQVFRPDGSATRVVAISEEAVCDMQVEFSDGTVIDTHSRHEWLLHRSWVQNRTARVFETAQVEAKGVWNGEVGRRGSRANFQLPHVAPLQGADAPLPLHPYALGVWLGDGTRTKPQITAHPDDIAMLEAVEACGYPQTRLDTHKTTGVLSATFASLRDPLRALGLWNPAYRTKGGWIPKTIPDAYFTASVAQRLELLAGLVDSDGYVYPQNGRITFSTWEPELAQSVARLVATFGWRVTTTWLDPALSSSGIQGRRPVAQVCWQNSLPIPCRLPRKRDAQLLDRMGRKRNITAVRRGTFGLGRCIQVEHDDGMYLAGDTLIPTHNSSLISRCLPPYLIGRLGPVLGQCRVAMSSFALSRAKANARDAKSIMLEPIHREIFPHASLLGFKGSNTADYFDHPFGFIKAQGAGGSLTGFSIDVALNDDLTKDAQEALSATVQDGLEDWYDSVLSTRLQERSGQVNIGTPWSANDIMARIHKKHAGKSNYKRLQFVALNEPDEVGYNPDQPAGPLVPKLHSREKLQEIKATMSDVWWAAMFQQAPLAALGAVFKPDGVRYYRRADLPRRFVQTIMSVDATFKDHKGSDYVAVGVWAKCADNRVWLLSFRREKLSFTATAKAIVDLKAANPTVTKIYIEDAANGPALIDMLGKHVNGIVGVPPMGSKEARAHAVSWVWANGSVMLPHPDEQPGIKPVVAEITAFPDVRNDDMVDCMNLALQQLCLRNPVSSMITTDILRMAGARHR